MESKEDNDETKKTSPLRSPPHHRASPEEVRHAAGSQSLERLQRAVVGWTAYELDEELRRSKSALHQAAWKGCLANVKFLVEELKCNVNGYSKAQYSYGKTAIFFALTQCRVDVVEYLLTVPHIKVTIVNNKGQSVRSLAASHNMPPSILNTIQRLEQQQQPLNDNDNLNYDDWWNFRASHSDGWEYGDVDPRFLDRPLRPDDVVSEHAINLTSKQSRPGGFARRNPPTTTTTPVPSKHPSRPKTSTRKRRSKNKTTSTMTEAEETMWKESLQLFQERQQQQLHPKYQSSITTTATNARHEHDNDDDDIFVEGLVTLVTLGTKQQRPWIPQVVEALSVRTGGQEEPVRDSSTCAVDQLWFGTLCDKAMLRIQTNRGESETPPIERRVMLLSKLRDKVLLGNPQLSIVPVYPRGTVSSNDNNKNKRDTARLGNHSRRSQTKEIWHSNIGQRAREQVAGLSLRRDLEEGKASSFLQLPEEPHFVDTLADLNKWRRKLADVPLMAVDTEWMDCTSNDDDPDSGCALSTIQVSYVQQPTNVLQVLVVDLKPAWSSTDYKDTANDMISTIFEQSDTLVLGFSIGQDLKILEQFLRRKLQPTTILDLQFLLGDGTLGLKACVAKYSQTPLSKDEQCSDWGRRPLSQNQLHYAGLDAAILLYLLAEYNDPLLPMKNGETNR